MKELIGLSHLKLVVNRIILLPVKVSQDDLQISLTGQTVDEQCLLFVLLRQNNIFFNIPTPGRTVCEPP